MSKLFQHYIVNSSRRLQPQTSTFVQALQEEFDSERSDMTSSRNRQKKEMADLMAAMETEFAEADSEARQEFEAAREEIRNRSSEEYNVLKISLEGQIEELERTFEAAHQAYLQNTGARATAFQTLTTNDAAAARVIEQRMKKLVQMQVHCTSYCSPQECRDILACYTARSAPGTAPLS